MQEIIKVAQSNPKLCKGQVTLQKGKAGYKKENSGYKKDSSGYKKACVPLCDLVRLHKGCFGLYKGTSI